jgi:hypothetical protein
MRFKTADKKDLCGITFSLFNHQKIDVSPPACLSRAGASTFEVITA